MLGFALASQHLISFNAKLWNTDTSMSIYYYSTQHSKAPFPRLDLPQNLPFNQVISIQTFKPRFTTPGLFRTTA